MKGNSPSSAYRPPIILVEVTSSLGSPQSSNLGIRVSLSSRSFAYDTSIYHKLESTTDSLSFCVVSPHAFGRHG